MNKQMKALTIALGTSMALANGAAMAESTYGYNSTGVGVVTATAKVNVSVTVPKLILLRVGSAGSTVDTLSWTTGLSIPATPLVPAATANNAAVTWDGTAPTATTSTNPAAVAVYAWSNFAGTTVNCAATAFAAGGPTLANLTVTSGAGLAHPGANLGACAATTAIAANTATTGAWTYALGGTPGTWTAGAYSSVITYTATSL